MEPVGAAMRDESGDIARFKQSGRVDGQPLHDFDSLRRFQRLDERLPVEIHQVSGSLVFPQHLQVSNPQHPLNAFDHLPRMRAAISESRAQVDENGRFLPDPLQELFVLLSSC